MASMFLGDFSGEEFAGFTIAKSSKAILASLSDAPEANPISNLNDDVEGWIDADKDITCSAFY